VPALEEDGFDGRRFLQRTAGNGCNEPTGHRYAARFSVERLSPPDRAVAQMEGWILGVCA